MAWWYHRHGHGFHHQNLASSEDINNFLTSSAARAKVRRNLLERLDSLRWILVIVVLVITDLAAHAGQSNETPLLSQVAMAIFGIDVILRLWAMGPSAFFQDWLCWIDFTLSVLDLVAVISPSTEVGEGEKSAGRLLRVIRVVRLIKLFRLSRVPSLAAWASEEMLNTLTQGDSVDEMLSNPVPQVMVVIAGTAASARMDVLQAVRRNWEIIIFADTGGFANTIFKAWSTAQNLFGVGFARGMWGHNASHGSI